MAPVTTAPDLRQTLLVVLDALTDAIEYRNGKYGRWCHDCRNSPVDHCAAHESDYAAAREYEEAERLIRTAHFGDLFREAAAREAAMT